MFPHRGEKVGEPDRARRRLRSKTRLLVTDDHGPVPASRAAASGPTGPTAKNLCRRLTCYAHTVRASKFWSERRGMDGSQACTRCGANLAADAAWCGRCGLVRRARGVEPVAPSASARWVPASTQPRAAAIQQKVARWWHGLPRRATLGTSIAVVVAVLCLAAVGGCAGTNGGASNPSSAPAAATPLSVAATPTSASAAAPTAAGSASPVASGADSDDETSSSAGASFAPTATGILPPTSGAGPADRLPGEPDPALTPGALNPAVTQATIRSTICVSGWTATIRPAESFTYALKVKQIVQYGYSDTKTSSYEEDHLISLVLGGAPADPRNLWPELYTIALADGRPTGAYTKDAFETKLKSEVCAGTITLAQGQSEIGDHWVQRPEAFCQRTGPDGALARRVGRGLRSFDDDRGSRPL